MRDRPIIIANWKLGLDHNQSVVLARKIASNAHELTAHTHIILSPSTASISQVIREFSDPAPVSFCAQNIHSEVLGAFTGETSVATVQQLGCRYVIVGHSERRRLFGETDAGVAKKTRLAFEFGLTPIVCVGETYEERQSGRAEIVVTNELRKALTGLQFSENQRIFIAYEPIWAISPGREVQPDEAKLMAMVIHQQLVDMFPEPLVQNFILIYGGSADASNIRKFIDGRIIRGAVVGAASQNYEDFCALVLALANK
ncbi:MAG: triose-phosphate isomerase [Patescibacteria group bacterium]|jgi:triosephosphate isomerase